MTLIDIDLGGEGGFAVVRKLVDDIGVDARSLILISTHAKEEFADLIEASPAAGFVSKSKSSLRRTRSARCSAITARSALVRRRRICDGTHIQASMA